MKQVLLNLVQNAMNDSTKDSTIHIDIYLDDGLARSLGRINPDSMTSMDIVPPQLASFDKTLVCFVMHERCEESEQEPSVEDNGTNTLTARQKERTSMQLELKALNMHVCKMISTHLAGRVRSGQETTRESHT